MRLHAVADAWTWSLIAMIGGCGGSTSEDRANIGGEAGGGTGAGANGGAAGHGAGGASGSGGMTQAGGSVATGGAAPSFFDCIDPRPIVNPDGSDTGFVSCGEPPQAGFRHRVRVLDCAVALPSPPRQCPAGSGCVSDADCSARPYGFCEYPSGGVACDCSYGCVRDSDCGSQQICECGTPVGRCVPATCTTDADCGGTFCATHNHEPYCYGVGYSCQAAGADDCMSELDCAGRPCGWDGMRRRCQDFICEPGRPFVVDGVARTAPAGVRSDWLAPGAAPDPSALSEPARARLAEYWLDAALAEHASIAAFARFVLQLLALGAPPGLILEAQAALADETRHAELCFALASSHAGKPLGPGPLVLDGALDSGADRAALLALVIREGCIGETVAALEARQALADASDRTVRAVLGRIHEDETRHAALAFRFVRWLLEQAPELRPAAAPLFEQEARRLHARRSSSPIDAELAGHGLLSGKHSDELRCYVRERVLPALCAEALGLGGGAAQAPAAAAVATAAASG